MAEEKKVAAKKAAPKAASAKKAAPKAEPAYVNRLVKKYKEQVVPSLIKEFGYTSPMQAPKF